MKVIFTEDVENIARSGQMKVVADGYARNYLIPQKLAVIATPGTLNAMAAKIEARKRSEALETAENKKIADEIGGTEITIEAKSGGGERLYGSVTNADIAEALEAASGYAIDKRKIKVAETINTIGTYNVEIKLAKDINAVIKVAVRGTGTPAATEEAA